MRKAFLCIFIFLLFCGNFSLAQTERNITATDLHSLAWRSIGPANMGGRISSIALVPGSRTEFFIGFGTAGAFKTDNLGTTFSPIFDKEAVASVGSIVVANAPGKDGRGKIVWIGTGEANNRNSSSWGNGVYRSVDGGKTLEHTGLSATHDIPMMAIDPRNPDVLYVAALGHLWGDNPERGVYKTSDGGKTWQHVLKIDEKTGACDVVVDPKNPNTVYAAMYSRLRTPWSYSGNSETGGIFRSEDGGKNWKKLTKGLPARTGRIGLAVFPKNPRILYAAVESDFGGSPVSTFGNRSRSGGLFRSNDRGESWNRVSDLSFRPFYFSRIAVDPEDDQRVYYGGWHFAISSDGGKTFHLSSPTVHVDYHALVVNPADPNQILVGNDGGLYISHDRGKNWNYINNIAAGQFYRVAVDQSDPYRIGGGLQDNGTWIGPSETMFVTEDPNKDGILNDDWKMVHGGDGFTLAFDPQDPNLVYATSQGGELVRVRLDNNVKKRLKPAEKEGEERLRFNWNTPYFISPHDPKVLYIGGNKVFKLTDRGDFWFAISGDLSKDEAGKTEAVGSDAETYGTVVALAESPKKKGMLWAGTDDGLIHQTSNDGKNWQDVTPAQVNGMYVSWIAPSTHKTERAYAAVDGHRSDVFKPLILMTEDAGSSWTEIQGDLPDGGPVKVVIEDPSNPDVLYCGTEFAAYATFNRGQNWIRLNGSKLPTVAVDAMVIHPREGDLIIGTHGRSIWILDDASMFAHLTPETRNQPLALFDILPGKPKLYTMRNYGIGDGLFRAKNPEMGMTIHYWIRDFTGEPVEISITNSSGLVVRKLKGTNNAGLNRVVWDLQADEKYRLESPDWLMQTEFVPEGDYKITVVMGKLKHEKNAKVLPAPNAQQVR